MGYLMLDIAVWIQLRLANEWAIIRDKIKKHKYTSGKKYQNEDDPLFN